MKTTAKTINTYETCNLRAKYNRDLATLKKSFVTCLKPAYLGT